MTLQNELWGILLLSRGSVHPQTSSSQWSLITHWCAMQKPPVRIYEWKRCPVILRTFFFLILYIFVEIFSISLSILLFILTEVSKQLNSIRNTNAYYIFRLWLFFSNLSIFFSFSIVLFSTLFILFYHFIIYYLICYRYINQIIKKLRILVYVRFNEILNKNMKYKLFGFKAKIFYHSL